MRCVRPAALAMISSAGLWCSLNQNFLEPEAVGHLGLEDVVVPGGAQRTVGQRSREQTEFHSLQSL